MSTKQSALSLKVLIIKYQNLNKINMKRTLLNAQVALHLKNIQTLLDLQKTELRLLEISQKALLKLDQEPKVDPIEEICSDNELIKPAITTFAL
jgi:hypothetical protein